MNSFVPFYLLCLIIMNINVLIIHRFFGSYDWEPIKQDVQIFPGCQNVYQPRLLIIKNILNLYQGYRKKPICLLDWLCNYVNFIKISIA